MAATNSNRITHELHSQLITDLRAAFANVENLLNFLVGLTTEDREKLPKMNSGNKPFTEDAINGASINSDIVPSYVKPAEMVKDLNLYNQLDEFVQRAARLSEKIQDTQMLAGSEAYVNALTIYRLAESAANAGVPGADTFYNKLKTRFAGQGKVQTPAASGAEKAA